MKRLLPSWVLAVPVITLAWAAGVARAGEQPPASPPPDAVAMVAGVPIRAAELEEEIRGALLELKTREYALKSRALDEMIARRLAEKAASARGITVAELVKVEVDDKVVVAEAEVRAFYEANKQRYKDAAEADALKQVTTQLRQQRLQERRQAFVRELRATADVKVLLEPLRVAVTPGDGPSWGPTGALVTIVEFSDFQCPYCARVEPALKRVRETYGDRVRFVFRDFPLVQIHPQAAKAAEAAACAGEQGKFWELHGRLFDNQARLAIPDLKQHAKELGLDAAKFGECLDSGRHAPDWQADLNEAAAYGVTGTPAFFINGRMLVGAQPYEAFAQVIDEELERAGSAAKNVPKDPKKKDGPS